MAKRLTQTTKAGIGAGVLALILWFVKETAAAFFFDKVLHMAQPVFMHINLAEFGPPGVFAVVCVVLLSWGNDSIRRGVSAIFSRIPALDKKALNKCVRRRAEENSELIRGLPVPDARKERLQKTLHELTEEAR